MTTKSHIRHNLTHEEKRCVAFGICERAAHGELLSEIAKDDGMPQPDTFRNWCHADPAIAIAWKDSQDDRIEMNMRELLKVADEDIPTYKDARGNVRMDPSATARMRVRVRTRQWLITLLVSHRVRHSHTEESYIPSTPPQHTAPSQPPQRPLENPKVPAAPVFTPGTTGRNGEAQLLVPMSRSDFQRYAALKDGEIDEQGNPVPLDGIIAPAFAKPSLYAENLPVLSVK